MPVIIIVVKVNYNIYIFKNNGNIKYDDKSNFLSFNLFDYFSSLFLSICSPCVLMNQFQRNCTGVYPRKYGLLSQN